MQLYNPLRLISIPLWYDYKDCTAIECMLLIMFQFLYGTIKSATVSIAISLC